MVRIYLSRHGQTLQNKLELERKLTRTALEHPSCFELTDLGRQQARRLGDYLFNMLGPTARPIFVTSTMKRTVDTAEIVAQQLGTYLNGSNHWKFPNVREQVPREYMQLHYGHDPRYKEYIASCKTANEIASHVEESLATAARNSRATDIIAILHKSINSVYLRAREVSIPSYYGADNCGLFINNGGEFSSYIENMSMVEDLKKIESMRSTRCLV